MPALGDVTHEYFEQLIGRTFELNAGETTMSLIVANVVMLPPPRRRTLTGQTIELATKRLPFSVYFQTEGGQLLTQGSYPLQPPEGEVLKIFLVPMGVEDGKNIYEAIFT